MNVAKLRLTSFQKNFNPFQSSSSLSIRASVAVVVLFPSSHVLSRYFLCFTQFGGGQYCFNFDKFHDTAPLQKKRKKEKKEERKKERQKERKKERKKEGKKERRKERKKERKKGEKNLV